MEQFPFIVRGFHSDNGSEFVNHQTAKLLEKLRIEFTKSRARRSNDNALVETKNGAVVRKWMGYQFLPSEATQAIDTFYRQWLNPYLNFHRPCAFASERRDRRGKLRKVYAEWSTPWEKLLSLPAEQRGLRADRSLKKLQARADHLFRQPSLPSNSTLSATNCNASAKTSRSAGARARQRPDPRRCRLLRPTSEDGRGVSPGMAAKGDWGAAPSPLCNPPHPALRSHK